jgi:hypothetical protein
MPRKRHPGKDLGTTSCIGFVSRQFIFPDAPNSTSYEVADVSRTVLERLRMGTLHERSAELGKMNSLAELTEDELGKVSNIRDAF